jgi:hypothetical protein
VADLGPSGVGGVGQGGFHVKGEDGRRRPGARGGGGGGGWGGSGQDARESKEGGVEEW